VVGLVSATVCAPPYIIGRVGILMLGSKVLLIPGIVLLAVGLTLQAGATGAVRAIKMSATLSPARRFDDAAPSPAGPSPLPAAGHDGCRDDQRERDEPTEGAEPTDANLAAHVVDVGHEGDRNRDG
jgi:hypothetical protein